MSGVEDTGASVGVPPTDASVLRARAGTGKVLTLEDPLAQSPCGKLQHTPLSQPSTAPSTPQLSFSPNDEGCHSAIFFRCISGASTIEPVIEQEHDDDDWDETLPPLPDMQFERERALEEGLLEVKELYRLKFGEDVDQEADEGEDCEYDADGTPWIKHVGAGPLTVAVLEDRLAEVRELYKARYGLDVDAESDEEDYEYDEDGTAWIKVQGTGHLSVDVLEDKLAELKELYEARYGRDVDAESEEECEYDADGTPWIKHVGTGPLTVAVLEDKLAEVRELYEARYGRDVDAESDEEDYEYDQDGTPWVKHVGTGPLTVALLEDRLAEVKELCRDRYGRDTDDESDDEYEHDEDGTAWIKVQGTGHLSVDVLEDKLAELKELYQARYGLDVDAESGEECEYDADGTPWIKHVGTGPLTVAVLEDKLAEVRELYKAKYGRDVDAESEDEYEYDADGTPWIKRVGTGPLTVAALEGKLAEVGELYEARYGHGVDVEVEEGYEYDDDGTAWTKVEGTGHLSVDVLEGKLAELKELYEARYGLDVDAESEEDFDYDGDGTAWIKVEGTGRLSVDVLEDKLAEVKELYKRKHGRDADEESEPDLEYDADGTPWVKSVGTGPLTVDVLEERLAEVKQLYTEKFGGDVDDYDDSCEYVYDKEGTLWTATTGTGPLTVSVLEDKLAEVKGLYQDAFGLDADSESDEGSEFEYDADGTPWKVTTGAGPLTVGVLEDKLSEVKGLYRDAFGCDVDSESDEGSEFEYDADGALWTKTVGQGPLTLSVLEDKLAEVKALYGERYGRHEDEDSDGEEDEQLERDEDGTPWIKTVGRGPLTFEGLEGKLAEVKALYGERYGRDADEDSRGEGEQLERDEDGTLWIKTVGRGPLTVEVLEDGLEGVKALYERRFGRFAEEESEDGEPDLQYDQDGALWFKWEGVGAGTRAA